MLTVEKIRKTLIKNHFSIGEALVEEKDIIKTFKFWYKNYRAYINIERGGYDFLIKWDEEREKRSLLPLNKCFEIL